jgi:hypothetical protein
LIRRAGLMSGWDPFADFGTPTVAAPPPPKPAPGGGSFDPFGGTVLHSYGSAQVPETRDEDYGEFGGAQRQAHAAAAADADEDEFGDAQEGPQPQANVATRIAAQPASGAASPHAASADEDDFGDAQEGPQPQANVASPIAAQPASGAASPHAASADEDDFGDAQEGPQPQANVAGPIAAQPARLGDVTVSGAAGGCTASCPFRAAATIVGGRTSQQAFGRCNLHILCAAGVSPDDVRKRFAPADDRQPDGESLAFRKLKHIPPPNVASFLARDPSRFPAAGSSAFGTPQAGQGSLVSAGNESFSDDETCSGAYVVVNVTAPSVCLLVPMASMFASLDELDSG